MKKQLLTAICVLSAMGLTAQNLPKDISRSNSWIKVGLNAGLPIAKLAETTSFNLGGEIKGQLMSTPNWGLGLTSGYTHFFPKEGFENHGTVPAGLFARYYPAREGVFFGADLGYSFMTGSGNNGNGGAYARPQVGYHNRHWNFFGFYNGIFRSTDKGSHVQHVGIGATYNIMFD